MNSICHHILRVTFLLIVVAFPMAAHGQTTWTGTGGNDLWFNTANWDTGIVPSGITDDVFIGAPSPTEVNGSVNLNSLTVGADVIVSIGNGLVFGFGGTATTTLSNLGTINLGQFSDFYLLNQAANSGDIVVDGSGNFSRLLTQASGATLSGGGTVTLDGNAASISGVTGAVLTIADQTVQGNGNVGNNTAEIVNTVNGLIDANVSGETITFNASVAGATNNGVMRASNGDQFIDSDDLAVRETQYGTVGAPLSSASVVPEPTSLLLAVATCLFGSFCRRRI